MKTMVTWSAKSGEGVTEAVSRFLAGKAAAPEGVTMLGRWHSVDLSIGFTLYETDDVTRLYAFSIGWADILDITNYIVIEDSEAGPIIASLGKK
jgi:hypothetical protein